MLASAMINFRMVQMSSQGLFLVLSKSSFVKHPWMAHLLLFQWVCWKFTWAMSGICWLPDNLVDRTNLWQMGNHLLFSLKVFCARFVLRWQKLFLN